MSPTGPPSRCCTAFRLFAPGRADSRPAASLPRSPASRSRRSFPPTTATPAIPAATSVDRPAQCSVQPRAVESHAARVVQYGRIRDSAAIYLRQCGPQHPARPRPVHGRFFAAPPVYAARTDEPDRGSAGVQPVQSSQFQSARCVRGPAPDVRENLLGEAPRQIQFALRLAF